MAPREGERGLFVQSILWAADNYREADTPEEAASLRGFLQSEVERALLAAAPIPAPREGERFEKACGCVFERVTDPVVRYVEACGESGHIFKLEGLRIASGESAALLAAAPSSGGEVTDEDISVCPVCSFAMQDGSVQGGDREYDSTLRCGNYDCAHYGQSSPEITAALRTRSGGGAP